MSAEPSPPPPPNFALGAARARATSQPRSAARQQRISEAAIAVIARYGIAGLTHRRVADAAGVSLAATTYHYQSRLGIIADAAARLLDAYVADFRRVLERHRNEPGISFRELIVRVVANAAGRHNAGALAWCEIILDAARNADTRDIASAWFEELHAIWLEIAVAFGVPDAPQAARSAIDMVVGLIFAVIPLGLDDRAVRRGLLGEEDFTRLWAPELAAVAPAAAPKGGRKAEETRERILVAAIDLLVDAGVGAVSYRAIGLRTGLTAPAATYHFPSIDSLLDAAQGRLFDAAKDRYRIVMANADYGAMDVGQLADLTTTIFQREATEFGPVSMASYPVWLGAARHPRLRPAIWAAIEDQNRAWRRLIERIAPAPRPLDPLIVQSLFRGKQIRIVATGARLADLAEVRGNFLDNLRRIGRGESGIL